MGHYEMTDPVAAAVNALMTELEKRAGRDLPRGELEYRTGDISCRLRVDPETGDLELQCSRRYPTSIGVRPESTRRGCCVRLRFDRLPEVQPGGDYPVYDVDLVENL